MSPSWNTAFTVVRHVLICTLLAVSIGTVVYMGKTFTKKLEPTINYVNSSCKDLENAFIQVFGTKENRVKFGKNIQETAENAKELTEKANKALDSANDILNSDKELSEKERKQLGENIRKSIACIKELVERLERGEGGRVGRALFGTGKSPSE